MYNTITMITGVAVAGGNARVRSIAHAAIPVAPSCSFRIPLN